MGYVSVEIDLEVIDDEELVRELEDRGLVTDGILLGSRSKVASEETPPTTSIVLEQRGAPAPLCEAVSQWEARCDRDAQALAEYRMRRSGWVPA